MAEQGDQTENPHSPIVFRVEPRVRTPQEQKIEDMGRRVNRVLDEKLKQSSTLSEFILSYYGVRLKLEGDIKWMWDHSDPTEQDVIDFFRNDGLKREAENDAKIVDELKSDLQKANSDRPGIQVILKRIRDRYGYYRYGILAQFPKGVQAENPVLGRTPLELTQAYPDTVFFKPTAACVLHACDDLYKIHRNSVFEIPYKSREQAIRLLQKDEQGINEYQLKKTEEETIKQDAGNYITVGLQSAFSNEPYVVPVSRFWATQEG